MGAFEKIKFSDIVDGYDDSMDEDWADIMDDEWSVREQPKYEKEKFDKKSNIKRDKQGRLNEGALLAKKDNCNAMAIWLRYTAGMTVKEIVECMGCSKSTVYSVIKQHKERKE